jgi:hypothetical protein
MSICTIFSGVVRQSSENNSRDFGIFELDKAISEPKGFIANAVRGAAGKTPVFGLSKR